MGNFNKRLFAIFEMLGLISTILVLVVVSITYIDKTSAINNSLKEKVDKLDSEFEGVKFKLEEWEEIKSGANVDLGKESDKAEKSNKKDDGTKGENNKEKDKDKNKDKGKSDEKKSNEDDKKEDINAEITAEGLNLREGPNTSAEVLDTLNTGAIVKLTGNVESNGGYIWAEVETSDGVKGWVVSDYLK